MRNKRFRNSTFLQYFLSYILILVISVAGIYIIVNIQLRNEFESTYEAQDDIETKNLAHLITNQILDINKTNQSIENDIGVIMYRYLSSDYMRYQASILLQKHIAGNSLIQDIIYVDRKTSNVLSVKLYVKSKGDIISVSLNGELFFDIPYLQILGSEKRNFIMKFGGDGESLLLYIPPQQSMNFAIFYVINETEMRSILNIGISHSLTAVSLVDERAQMLCAVNGEKIEPYLQKLGKDDTVGTAGEKIKFVSTNFTSIRLVTLSDMNFVKASVNSVFRSAYLLLIVIIIAGIFFTFIFMKMTYIPLHNLTARVAKNRMTMGSELERISEAFEDVQAENEDLLARIRQYRIEIQKSLIDAIVDDNGRISILSDRIDDWFNGKSANAFFVACVLCPESKCPCEAIDEIIQQFPEDVIGIMLEKSDKRATYLFVVNSDEEGDVNISRFFSSIVEKRECKIALSDIATSPMDIARLYDHAILTTNYMGEQNIISYLDIRQMSYPEPVPEYPYEVFDRIKNSLDEEDFEQVGKQIDQLFQTIDIGSKPDFFIRCILIDTITMIVNSINKINVRFEKFSELYYRTLYLYRNSDYKLTKNEILLHIHQILEIFAEETMQSKIQTQRILNFVKENCMSSNFSVTMMGDHFNVSAAYMSNLFKKKIGVYLSDYVWQLRLEKAEELLLHTDLSIEQISVSVGYDNPSSFRRKFKEATKKSPVEFRNVKDKGIHM